MAREEEVRVIFANQTCSNCRHRDGSNPKQCKKCYNRDTRRGWEPADGVTFEYRTVYLFKPGGKMVVDVKRVAVMRGEGE